VSSSTPHPQAIFSPSTTIHAETENNTSQSALFTDEYYNYITTEVGATNGDTPNQHISKLPISTLLTGEAANTKIYVETQSWFCHSTSNEVSGPSGTTLKAGPSHCGSHNDIGHNSGDMSVVTAQFQDMQSRGISGVVVDWDGQPVLPNGTTSTSGEIIQNNAAIDNFRKLAEASDGKFTFAVSEDEGVAACIKGWVPCVAAPAALGTGMKASAEAQAISDINYIVNTPKPT
jgi:hypothetical protein